MKSSQVQFVRKKIGQILSVTTVMRLLGQYQSTLYGTNQLPHSLAN